MDRHEVMRFIAFKNKSTQYSMLHKFREALSQGLVKAGVDVQLVDLDLSNLQNFLTTIYSSPPDCTFAFNGIRALEDGETLAEKIDIPHISWQVDAVHFCREFAKMPLQLIITPDKISADIFRKWGAKAFFLPHGGELLPLQDEKSYPIAFFCSLADPEETEQKWLSIYTPSFVDRLKGISEQVLSTPDLCYQEALKALVDIDDPEQDELLQSFDVYLRMKERLRLIRSLKGLPLHLFGNVIGDTPKSFQELVGSVGESFTFHSALDISEALEVMRRSSIVLNSSPMFKTGAHERIFYGQGAGALVVTSDTSWIRRNYEVGKEILTFNYSEGKRTAEEMKRLLQNPKELEEMALLGREKMAREHTWDRRAEQLVKIAETELPKFFE